MNAAPNPPPRGYQPARVRRSQGNVARRFSGDLVIAGRLRAEVKARGNGQGFAAVERPGREPEAHTGETSCARCGHPRRLHAPLAPWCARCGAACTFSPRPEGARRG